MQSYGFNSALSPVVYGDIALSINTHYITLHLSLPRFQDIFPAMKSCLASIWSNLFSLVGCYGNEFENLR